jgi:hypothetical protein
VPHVRHDAPTFLLDEGAEARVGDLLVGDGRVGPPIHDRADLVEVDAAIGRAQGIVNTTGRGERERERCVCRDVRIVEPDHGRATLAQSLVDEVAVRLVRCGHHENHRLTLL